jgi:hypothetical protein
MRSLVCFVVDRRSDIEEGLENVDEERVARFVGGKRQHIAIEAPLIRLGIAVCEVVFEDV